MNIYIKQAIVTALLIVASSQAMAQKDTMQNKERPPRPTFESIDTNEDGDIDFEEFSAHKLPHGDPQTIFNDIDTDNNGIISNDEFINHKPPQPQNRQERQ